MPNIVQFRGVKAVAAYAGLSPRHYRFGPLRRRAATVIHHRKSDEN